MVFLENLKVKLTGLDEYYELKILVYHYEILICINLVIKPAY